MNKKRYYMIDCLRGFALINMIIYHSVWDLVYLYGFHWPWYRSTGAHIWQQFICWTFILISGFCFSFGREKLKRGIVVFGCGLIITICTCLFMPDNRVVFGILTLIGSCMLIMIPLEKILKKVTPFVGVIISAILFIITRNVNDGYLGFEAWNLIKLPKELYENLLTTYLGFPERGFYSTDYFSIFPWLFLFIAGYFVNALFTQKDLLKYLEKSRCKWLEWLGQHSLIIYVVHQPVIYFLFLLIF